MTKRLIIDVTNERSLYVKWCQARRFRGPAPVYSMSPAWLENALMLAGFRVVKRRGVGLLTPLSLRGGFKGVLVPPSVSRAISWLDPLFAKWCHMYLVVAE